MIYKICPKCNTLYEVGKSCPNNCIAKIKKRYNKHYDKYKRKNKEVYHSKRWLATRKTVLEKYDNICLYTLYKYDKIRPATLIHHIVEVNEDRKLTFDLKNLIPLCDDAHREIHNRYKNEDIKKVQKELVSFKLRYEGRGV